MAKKAITGCDCIEKLEKALIEKHGEGSRVKIKLDMWFNMATGDAGSRFRGIEYSYRKRKKNGTYYNSMSQSSVTHNYCPVCGVKIEH